ncbi:MAG: alpha-amylase family glycosyl hydrolase [Chloroflexota bacterium]
MDDFIFGTLATEELRLKEYRRLRSGITHDQRRTPRAPLPGEPVTLDLTIGPQHRCERAWVYWTNDGSDPAGDNGVARNGFCTPMEPAGAEWELLLWGYVRRFRATLPPQPEGSILRYRIAAGPPQVYADDGAYYACHVADHTPPAWAQDAVLYQVFSERFNPGGGRTWLNPARPSGLYGGTLRGITEKMAYIAELGANVIWLTPIFPSPSHHGYDATDLFEIEPRLGTKADLKSLLDAAHAHGIRVLLDFVPNHISHEHPLFVQARTDPDSHYRHWFEFIHWPDEYDTFFGVKSLPEINLRNPDARQHVLDAAVYWLNFGVDGFRVDYTAGPTPDFWAEFHRATRQAKPDCWTFGEMVYPSDQQLNFEGTLDGCLDFILLEALRQTFAFGRWSGERFAAFLDGHESFFPLTFSRPSFLDNHDMNRMLWVTQCVTEEKGHPEQAIPRLKLAALCQFTLAGPPIVYYGTEVGLSQLRDIRQGTHGIPEEARLPMPWDGQDADLLDFYRRLIALRRTQPALRRGQRQTILADENTIAYTRADGEGQLLVMLNLSAQAQTLSIPAEWQKLAFVTDAGVGLKDGKIYLPALAGAVLSSGREATA